MSNLEVVLKWLEEARMKLQNEKCAFLMTEVEYWGHKPTNTKVYAVAEAPEPPECSRTEIISSVGKLL